MIKKIKNIYHKIPYKKTIGTGLLILGITVGGFFYGTHQKQAGIEQGKIEGINMLSDTYKRTSEYYNSTVKNWETNISALHSARAMAGVMGYDADKKEAEFRNYANTSKIVADELQALTQSQIETIISNN